MSTLLTIIFFNFSELSSPKKGDRTHYFSKIAYEIFYLHCFPLRIPLVNMSITAVSCGFIHIYYINSSQKIWFFCAVIPFKITIIKTFPAGIYMFKINNGNNETSEICSTLAIKTPQSRSFLNSIINLQRYQVQVIWAMLLKEHISLKTQKSWDSTQNVCSKSFNTRSRISFKRSLQPCYQFCYQNVD